MGKGGKRTISTAWGCPDNRCLFRASHVGSIASRSLLLPPGRRSEGRFPCRMPRSGASIAARGGPYNPPVAARSLLLSPLRGRGCGFPWAQLGSKHRNRTLPKVRRSFDDNRGSACVCQGLVPPLEDRAVRKLVAAGTVRSKFWRRRGEAGRTTPRSDSVAVRPEC